MTRAAQTVLFADISGSTKLCHELGNEKANHLIRGALKTIELVIGQHHGRVIKEIGDEVLCIFDYLDNAVDAAIEIQKIFSYSSSSALHTRVGFFTGHIIRFEGKGTEDIYGDAVNMAARVVDYARSGMIVTTREIVELLPEQYRKSAYFIGAALFKGKPNIVKMYNITSDENERKKQV